MNWKIVILCLLGFLVMGSAVSSQEADTAKVNITDTAKGKYRVSIEVVYNELDMNKAAELAKALTALDKRFGSPCELEILITNASNDYGYVIQLSN